MPCLWKIEASLSSVSLFPLDRTAAMIFDRFALLIALTMRADS
jgi:hypothetical protein